MRVKGDEHYVNMKRKKSKEHTKEKYFLHRAFLAAPPAAQAHTAHKQIF